MLHPATVSNGVLLDAIFHSGIRNKPRNVSVFLKHLSENSPVEDRRKNVTPEFHLIWDLRFVHLQLVLLFSADFLKENELS